MYAFMYVDPETLVEEEYFPYTKIFVGNYKEWSNTGLVPKHWLGFSYIYICSDDYELDINFDETDMKEIRHISEQKI